MERRGSLQGSGKSLGSGGGLWEAPAVSNRLSRDESYDTDDMYDHHEANELHERGHSMSAVEAGEARTLLRWVARLMAADPMWRSLYPLTEFGALCAAARDGELLHRLVSAALEDALNSPTRETPNRASSGSPDPMRTSLRRRFSDRTVG